MQCLQGNMDQLIYLTQAEQIPMTLLQHEAEVNC